jgi:AmpD protein
VLQFVPFHRRAWHAGESSHQGRSLCNDFSIGIELEGTDDTPYRPAQYQRLVAVCRQLMNDYAIDVSRIVGHCHIAPGRKTDPGEAFNWQAFRDLLDTESTSEKGG